MQEAKRTPIPPCEIQCCLCKKKFTASVEIDHETREVPKEPMCYECFQRSVRMLKLFARKGDAKAKELLKTMVF